MPLVRCIEGHVFDRAAHTACPTCGALIEPPRPTAPELAPDPIDRGGQGQTTPVPRKGISLALVAGVVAGILVLGGVGYYLHTRPADTIPTPPPLPPAPTPTPAPTPAPTPPAPTPPAPTPPPPAPAPQPTPAPTPPPSPPADNFVIPRASPPPATAPNPGQLLTGTAQFDPATGALTVAGRPVQLFGIQSDPSQAAAAGRFLQQITNGTGDVTCKQANAGTYDCHGTSSNVRLAAGLLMNGLARAARGVPTEFGRWEEEARDARRGLWASQ